MAKRKLIESWIHVTKGSRFSRCMDKAQVVKIENGHCIINLCVQNEHTNVFGILHGGFTATVFDNISYFALKSHPRFVNTPKFVSGLGVTLEIHVTYLNPVNFGENLLFEAKTMGLDERLANIETSVTDSNFSKIYAKGSTVISLFS